MKNKVKVVSKLRAKPTQFPENSSKFNSANRYASKIEKKNYPKGYKKLSKIDRHLPSKEILGHINKKGQISISSKVPKKYRKEVEEHEQIERKKILGKSR